VCLPAAEETRDKMRLSAGNGCLLLLLSVSTLIIKTMSDGHRWIFLLVPFAKWSEQFIAVNVYACVGSALLSRGGIPEVFCFTSTTS